MDRIYKALELAKNQNVATAADSRFDDSHNADHPEEFLYTKTRVWRADDDTMRQNRIIAASCDPAVEACYKLLRTRVLRRLEDHGWKTIGITSTRPGEGKTLTAINLGIAIAQDPKYSVLLVDADLRRPNVHEMFGFKPEFGLEDYLTSRVPLQQLLVNPGIERFVFIPSCERVRGSSEHLASRRMNRLVDDLKSRYPSRFVMFDLPPALVADDVVAFSSQLDAVLIVIEDGKTQAGDLKRMLELLEGTTILGTVLNKFAGHEKKYDDYYRKVRG